MTTSGKRLKELREKAGYTLRDLALITGISKATLSRYENNDLENISLDKLEILAKALNTSKEYLINDQRHITIENLNSNVLENIIYNESSKNDLVDELEEFRKELERSDLFDAINYKLKLLNKSALEQMLNYATFLSAQENMMYSTDYITLQLSFSAQKIISYIKTTIPNITNEEIMQLIEKQFEEYKEENKNSHSDKE